ncbi:MAG: hypothetical protein K2Y32_20495 [Candidatus Obscuribacterales bacterium]|nr:hypothetical protein [Candidatus Obscuribacterales bacterium]
MQHPLSDQPSIKERLYIFMSEEYFNRREFLLSKFNELFPDEVSCWAAVIEEFGRMGLLACKHCSSESVQLVDGFRKYRCDECHRNSQTTAGTFLHGVKKIRAWLFAVWIVDNGFYVSSKWLGQAIGVSQSSALHIIKSAMLALEMRVPGYDTYSIETFRFREFFAKRSVLTPALVKPKDEMNSCFDQTFNSDNADFYSSDSCEEVKGTSSICPENQAAKISTEYQFADQGADQGLEKLEDKLSAEILTLLKAGPKSINDIIESLTLEDASVLEVLTELELAGRIRGISGGRFVLSNSSSNTLSGGVSNLGSHFSDGDILEAHSDLWGIKDVALVFMRMSMKLARGLSRKYLSLYIGLSNELVLGEVYGNFLQICLSVGYIGNRKLNSYVVDKDIRLALSEGMIA